MAAKQKAYLPRSPVPPPPRARSTPARGRLGEHAPDAAVGDGARPPREPGLRERQSTVASRDLVSDVRVPGGGRTPPVRKSQCSGRGRRGRLARQAPEERVRHQRQNDADGDRTKRVRAQHVVEGQPIHRRRPFARRDGAAAAVPVRRTPRARAGRARRCAALSARSTRCTDRCGGFSTSTAPGSDFNFQSRTWRRRWRDSPVYLRGSGTPPSPRPPIAAGGAPGRLPVS